MVVVVVTIGNLYDSSGDLGLGKKIAPNHCVLSGDQGDSYSVIVTSMKTEHTGHTHFSNSFFSSMKV